MSDMIERVENNSSKSGFKPILTSILQKKELVPVRRVCHLAHSNTPFCPRTFEQCGMSTHDVMKYSMCDLNEEDKLRRVIP